MSDQLPPGRIKDIRVYRDSFAGMCLLACIPFLIFGALGVYGWWPAIALFLIWAVVLAQATRWFMPHPRWVIGAGVFTFACWLAVVVVARLS